MKANELMIGDWVLKDMNYLEEDPMYTRLDYQPYQIENGEDIGLACESNCLGDADVYQPIPLTDEILEANGWEREGGVSKWSDDNHIINIIHWSKDRTDVQIYTRGSQHLYDVMLNIRNVHTLQHALRLCGIEKEIIVKLEPCPMKPNIDYGAELKHVITRDGIVERDEIYDLDQISEEWEKEHKKG